MEEFTSKFNKLPGAILVWHSTVDAALFRSLCEQTVHDGGRLVALWGSDEREREARYALHILLATAPGMLCLTIPVSTERPAYPDISDLFPCASRMQRAVADLLGLHATGADDQRKWLRHASWPSGVHPLRKDFEGNNVFPTETDAYPFVAVSGDGVHEIPVGPVHAGTIEPGHFRFSIIGDRVLRLEERLGYKHKGIEKRFEGMSLEQGAKLAGRVSGDSTVAYAWAYAMAAESIAGVTPPDQALWLRALFLERERMANHLGDLGYLGNDVALAFGFAQFWILKEQLLRNNAMLFGHRYLMDRIIPGGVAIGLKTQDKRVIEDECSMLERELALLRSIYEEHAGMQDRFIGAGCVAPPLAAQLGLCGLPGRASSQSWDARTQFPCAPYDKLDVQMATHHNGDVAARVIVRFDELFESLRLQRGIMANLVGGDELSVPVKSLSGNTLGIGLVEGWRGEVMVALHTDALGNLERVHPHDPSWQNWPVLEHAIIGNIVPDFPLINKSFSLSYAGQDL